MLKFFKIFIASLLLSSTSFGVESPPSIAPKLQKATEPRNVAYSIAIAGYRHNLKGDEYEFIGNAAAVQIGSLYLSDTWFTSLSLDILLGPFDPSRNEQIVVDYSGTGISFWMGLSAQTLSLRSPEGGHGFAIGFNYSDLSGRSSGKNRKEDFERPERNNGLIDNYVARINSISLLPSLFFTWLTPSRPKGNSPELLATRLEGYLLTLGGSIPLSSNYSARYTLRPGSINSSSAPSGQIQEHGTLDGYSIMVSLTAILGV